MTSGHGAALPERRFAESVAAEESGSRLDVWLSAGSAACRGPVSRAWSKRDTCWSTADAQVRPSPQDGRARRGECPAAAPGGARPGAHSARCRVRGRARARARQAGGDGRRTRAPAARPARSPRRPSPTRPTIAGVGGPRRPGIVHRLDKGTSGLILLAKTREAYDSLTRQLARRAVSRRYVCDRARPAQGERRDHRRARSPATSARGCAWPWPARARASARSRASGSSSGSGRPRWWSAGSRPGEPTRSVSTSRPWAIRSSATRPTAAGRRRPADPVFAELAAGLEGVALHAVGLGFAHPVTGAEQQLAVTSSQQA